MSHDLVILCEAAWFDCCLRHLGCVRLRVIEVPARIRRKLEWAGLCFHSVDGLLRLFGSLSRKVARRSGFLEKGARRGLLTLHFCQPISLSRLHEMLGTFDNIVHVSCSFLDKSS